MRYFLAWLLPPAAMLACVKPVQAVLSLLMCMTLVGWIPAAMWAYATVAEANANARNRRLIRSIRSRH